MHELSVVMNIVEMAEKTARKYRVKRVESIHLDIGVLAGIEMDALEFIWESGVRGSVLEGAERQIHLIRGKGKCLECNVTFDMNHIYATCPQCAGYAKEILKGKELRLKSMIVNKN